MLLDVMLIHKEENSDIATFKRDFQHLISFEEKNLCLGDLKFKYNIQKSETQKVLRLKVATLENKNTKKEADSITVLKNKLTRGKHRKNYHIVFIFDGASKYYCNKLFRFISVFERKLRQFIYLSVLNNYGKDWAEETLMKEIQTKIKKNKNHTIEEALNFFTFRDYINYLFTKRNKKDPYSVIREAIDALAEGKEANTQVLNILKSGEGISLWDKFFNGFNIDFNENEINKIKNIRNDIVHNKEVSSSDFNEYKKLLKNSIKKLDKGIFNAERQKYSSNVDITDILYHLSETMKSMTKISEAVDAAIFPAISEIQKTFQRLMTVSLNRINSSALSSIEKNTAAILKKSYADIAILDTKSITNIAILQNNFSFPSLDACMGLQIPSLRIPLQSKKSKAVKKLKDKDKSSKHTNALDSTKDV